MCTLYINLWLLAIHYEYLMISILRILCLPFSELICIYIIAHNISFIYILYRYFFLFFAHETQQHTAQRTNVSKFYKVLFVLLYSRAKSWRCLCIHNSIIVLLFRFQLWNKYHIYLKSNDIRKNDFLYILEWQKSQRGSIRKQIKINFLIVTQLINHFFKW